MFRCLVLLAWAVAGLGFIIGDMNSPAAAQQRCAEGRMKNGQCVNAGLARTMRVRAKAAAQPKISVTAAPVPLGAERSTSGTKDYFELNRGIFRSAPPCKPGPLGPVC